MFTSSKMDAQKLSNLAKGMKCNYVGEKVANATIERLPASKLISEATSQKLSGEKKEAFKAFLAEIKARVEAHPNDVGLRKYYDCLKRLV